MCGRVLSCELPFILWCVDTIIELQAALLRLCHRLRDRRKELGAPYRFDQVGIESVTRRLGYICPEIVRREHHD
jgi:hypothetical protein